MDKPTPQTGKQYWRSLEVLAETPQVRQLIEQEFAGYDPAAIQSMSRRGFMKVMGASMALAGLTLSGCRRWPEQRLAPYSAAPSNRIPGVPEQYATVMDVGGVAMGLLVSSHDGRPVKVEGNPSHPFARTFGGRLGAADAMAQASVLELYDPDRSRQVVQRDGQQSQYSDWEKFSAAAAAAFATLGKAQGQGLAILSEASSSPSVADMKRRLLAAMPQAQWYEYEPMSSDNRRQGTRQAAGRELRDILHLTDADVVVLLDADILASHPAHLRYAADWAARRRQADQGNMNRVYIAESRFSVTGMAADRRLALRPARVMALLEALAQRLGAVGGEAVSLSDEERKFVDASVADLHAAGKRAVVAVGEHLSPRAHALAYAINSALHSGAVRYVAEPGVDRPSHVAAITELTRQMAQRQVKTLLILGGNPAYDGPADLEFSKALGTVPLSIHLSHYDNETSALCRWHLPRAHYLECWGDGRAWDLTPSVAQPLIQPLFGGKSVIELLALLMGEALDGEQIVRRTWQSILAKDDFEKAWRRVLHDGVLREAAGAYVQPQAVQQSPTRSAASSLAGFDLRFAADYRTYDGRWANNGWLQELPDPLTKLTWDNAALLAPADAQSLGVSQGDLLRISVGGRSIDIAACLLPGQPAGVITLPLGYGRWASGSVGTKVGVNTYPLRTGQDMHYVGGATVKRTGRVYPLALTQDHHLLNDVGKQARDARIGSKGQSGLIIRETTLDQYKADPKFAHRDVHGGVHLQLFEPPRKFNDPHAWGMAIDMSSCIGCSGCVVACQAENNVPVVGKDQVLAGREMHWLRVDRYFKGEPADPAVVNQVMLCQHCETAPCEQVCPVAATVHDTEGLNTMVYNRCIGTRYCSNNCPYKVRRFNYFDFHAKDPRGGAKPWPGLPDTQQRQAIDQIKQMVFNPEVTVRMRGVMEKCTYCVQRIRAATSERRIAGQKLMDGDVVTACQQACPTQAIVFGDLNDPNSAVSQLHRNQRAYGVLEELNTQPRTKYLARITNPDPGSAPAPKPGKDHGGH